MTKLLVLDRRTFLGGIGFTAGSAAMGGLLSPSALQAVTFNGSPIKPNALSDHDPCADWAIDDICGAYPPYSHPIPYGRPQAVPLTAAHIELIDPFYVI